MIRLSKCLIAVCRTGIVLRGSSLLETMVAMSILLTILTMAFAGITRVNHSIHPQAVYKAHLATCEVLNRDDLLVLPEETYEIDGFIVKKELNQLDNKLYEVYLLVSDGTGKVLCERKLMSSHEIRP